jgi:hypothetical protein
LIFAVYSLVFSRGDGEPGKIVIGQGQIAAIEAGYVGTWHRPPTDDELKGLIRDRVLEEAYVREALALGLEKDDLIVRRRLRQKMEFIADGLAAPAEPSEAQLQAYLTANASTFATEPRLTFRQVYLDPQRHGANLARDAQRLLASLNQGRARAGWAQLGDPIPLPREVVDASARDVANQFGEKFAAALREVPLGEWQGPLESGYGVHLVALSERTGNGTPALDEVRDAVRRACKGDRQREASERYAQALLRKYEVIIEGAPVAGARPADSVAVR